MINSFSTLKIKSDLFVDNLTRALYATDASIYQIIPDAVIVVKDMADLPAILNFAKLNDYKILARGGATSLAGQTVAKAIVLDFSKYMNNIGILNKQSKSIIVQAGVIHGELNQYLKKFELHFAPDPATSNRATIGGMIANNSSGTKSILYGKTSDHVISLKVMLSDGSIVNFHNQDELSYDINAQQPTLEGEIYAKLRSVIFENTEEIKKRFPKIMRRVSGYALDAFTETKEWNLAKLICGSEGTLGIILEAELSLEPLPIEKAICLVHFSDRMEAIRSVQKIVEFGPSAVEMLDHNVLERCKYNSSTIEQYNNIIVGNPEAILICEFYGNSIEELQSKIDKLSIMLKQVPSVTSSPIHTKHEEMDDIWSLRKKGLGLLMGIPGNKKPLPFIEDSSIPLVHLADYIEDITTYCKEIDTDIVIYAHASVGVLHIRPYLDIKQESDINKMLDISNFALKKVLKYGGSWSGEHGDGLVRSPNLPQFFGAHIMKCFREIKQVFDPNNLFNPHKKTDALPMDQNLRYGPDYQEKEYDFVFQYRKEKDFESIVHNCSGISACRNKTSDAMCPSYRASLDEQDSPRGRANALRMVMSGQLEGQDLLSDELMEVLQLCLSCKACKSECPSNVDIAKLKSEVLQLRHQANKTTAYQKMIRHSDWMAKVISGPLAPIVNYFQKQGIIKNILQRNLGIDECRELPDYTRHSLEHWYNRNKNSINNRNKKVVIFADTYINYQETHIGIAAYHLLNSCGYDTEIISFGCCQRPKISNGFLSEAKEKGLLTAERLRPYLEAKIPILLCEPGCGSSLIDDLPDLIEDDTLTQLMKENIFLIDEYLLLAINSGELKGRFTPKSDHIITHTHCHQVALHGHKTTRELCQSETTKIEDENTGCCGMAGAFGYNIEHYEISKKVAERNLIPKLSKLESSSTLIANGTSCRHQIKDMANKKAKHWVEVVEYTK